MKLKKITEDEKEAIGLYNSLREDPGGEILIRVIVACVYATINKTVNPQLEEIKNMINSGAKTSGKTIDSQDQDLINYIRSALPESEVCVHIENKGVCPYCGGGIKVVSSSAGKNQDGSSAKIRMYQCKLCKRNIPGVLRPGWLFLKEFPAK